MYLLGLSCVHLRTSGGSGCCRIGCSIGKKTTDDVQRAGARRAATRLVRGLRPRPAWSSTRAVAAVVDRGQPRFQGPIFVPSSHATASGCRDLAPTATVWLWPCPTVTADCGPLGPTEREPSEASPTWKGTVPPDGPTMRSARRSFLPVRTPLTSTRRRPDRRDVSPGGPGGVRVRGCGEGWANHFSVYTRKESMSLSVGHTLRN